MAVPHDHFDRYFVEKLWNMVPEYYREEDGLAQPPGVLRGFIEVLAQQAATLRRSNDRLWDDTFIDLCSEWAVPYIGELVATRMVSALNPRGRRVDVAKTIYYRRRAGTPRILEELIADITGWEGKVVEEFRRLGRARHGLDPNPQPYAGIMTRTLPGGWANLRSAHGAELADSPFEEFHHTPDVRRPRGRDGRYGIAKLGFHLYRLASTRLDDITPPPGPVAGSFTFDPSGRDIPLFIRRHRTDDRERLDWEEWISAKEWEVPSPMRCRVLNHAPLVMTEQVLVDLRTGLLPFLTPANADLVIALLRIFRNQALPGEARLFEISEMLTAAQRNALRDPAVWNPLLADAVLNDCGKRALLPRGVSPAVTSPSSTELDDSDASVVVKTFRADLVSPAFVPAERELVVGGDLRNFTATIGGAGKQWVVDPRRGRLLWVGGGAAPNPLVSHHYGFSGDIGAGGYDRSDFLTSAVTRQISAAGGAAIQTTVSGNPNFLPPGGNVVPIVLDVAEISDSATYTPIGNRNQITKLELRAADRKRPYLRLTQNWHLDTSANLESELTIDGLWVGATGQRTIRLLGDYERVILRHMTIDPGGVNAAGNPITAVRLAVAGNVENLIIENSIVASIGVEATGELTNLEIRNSIVDGQHLAGPVISVPAGKVTMRGVTVFGEVEVEWLDASEALITGLTTVTNTQGGCFRFSAVLERLDPLNPLSTHSRVPHPYESYFVPDFHATFTSKVFGQPGYAQLAESAPQFLHRGAENQSEIGAFSSLLNPIKFDSLRAKVEEFAPFGLLPAYVFET
jgi:hypothetical protein